MTARAPARPTWAHKQVHRLQKKAPAAALRRFQRLLRQAVVFGAEEEHVAGKEATRRPKARALCEGGGVAIIPVSGRLEGDESLRTGLRQKPGFEGRPILVYIHTHVMPIVQARAFQALVVKLEAQRRHETQASTEGGAGAADGTSITSYLGIHQDHLHKSMGVAIRKGLDAPGAARGSVYRASADGGEAVLTPTTSAAAT